MKRVVIYGKDNCPFTTNARKSYEKQGYDVEYVNVIGSSDAMEAMLRASGGMRKVPVIVEGDSCTVGFGGT
ncbi:MAG TPA: hypothetical protein EYP57_04285 [Thermodesulfobacteriaceae bacterium]|nr:hypothetical protein [Thermodesulfobacteriaceae bacterium]